MAMVQIGNHLKMNIPFELRERTRDFYAGLLKCKPMASPNANLDLYEFDAGFVLGLFFGAAPESLSEAEHLRATWMELKVDDTAAWKARLLAFGVREVEYPDATRFFFQAPGGQVFRLAPLDGGI
ncbi:MAG TPA: hypothetical protein VJX23_08355 [Candidatus Binataceae bacterium]|nr:hypothetical protein [Candidatus Binataceae bacterium]